MQRCQIGVLYEGTAQKSAVFGVIPREGTGHDRDAEIAAFIRTKGVTRCPTACVVPTQGSPDRADQAALEQHAVARELLRTKSATRWQVFGSLRVRD
jgi:hypothetical protein